MRTTNNNGESTMKNEVTIKTKADTAGLGADERNHWTDGVGAADAVNGERAERRARIDAVALAVAPCDRMGTDTEYIYAFAILLEEERQRLIEAGNI